MMKYRLLIFLCTKFLVSGVYSVIQYISCDQMQNHCLNQLVQYQCTVTDSFFLRWRINNENMKTIETKTYTNVEKLTSLYPLPDAPDFSTDLTSVSPLISNISFTAQSSINGYSIYCEDEDGNAKNCTIDVSAPPPPVDISFVFTTTSINFSWVPPSSQCIGSYEVESNATNSTLTTTDTSVSIPLAGLTTTTYYVSVASVDTANRTGEYSDRISFELTVPAQPGINYQSVIIAPLVDNVTIILSLMFNQSNIPLLKTAHVLFNQSDVVPEFLEVQRHLDHSIGYNFSAIIRTGINYTITAFGENILGNGSNTSQFIFIHENEKDNPASCLPDPEPVATPLVPVTSATMSLAPSSEDTSSNSSNNASMNCPVERLSVVVGISVAIAVPITAVITASITVFIMYLCTTTGSLKNSEQPLPLQLSLPSSTSPGLELKSNSAYGDINYKAARPTRDYDTVNY